MCPDGTQIQIQEIYTMRKLFIVFTLAFTYVATSASAARIAPPAPTCDPNCPWIR